MLQNIALKSTLVVSLLRTRGEMKKGKNDDIVEVFVVESKIKDQFEMSDW